MTIGFVLGNGISRQAIELRHLQKRGKIYGCNALYREFTPDVLVATDTPIAKAIQESKYALTHCFYTRRPIANLGAHVVPKEYFGYSSGPIAVSLAAKDQNQRVYLLGFDMGPNETAKFNNIYAGTEFYKPVGASPTFTGNWLRQLCQVITNYPNTQFFRVCGVTTNRLADLEKLTNLHHQPMADFLDRINNPKDL